MYAPHKAVFLSWIADQCHLSLYGVRILEDGLNKKDNETIWLGVPIFLTGAANVAKTLWGSGGRLSEERKPIREALEVDDTSVLRDVSLRNHFEHYDERLDRWRKSRYGNIILDQMIGDPASVTGVPHEARFRVIDPATQRIYFCGDEYPIADIVDELRRIWPLAAEKGQNLNG